MSRSLKVLLGVLGGAVVVLVVLTLFAGSGLFGSSPNMMGWGDMMGQGWGILGVFGMGLMMLGMVLVPLLLGGLIAAIVLAVTQLGSKGQAASERPSAGSAGVHEHSAEEALRQRFARGAIDQEEYEERRRILRGEREQSPAAHR